MMHPDYIIRPVAAALYWLVYPRKEFTALPDSAQDLYFKDAIRLCDRLVEQSVVHYHGPEIACPPPGIYREVRAFVAERLP